MSYKIPQTADTKRFNPQISKRFKNIMDKTDKKLADQIAKAVKPRPDDEVRVGYGNNSFFIKRNNKKIEPKPSVINENIINVTSDVDISDIVTPLNVIIELD